MDFPPPFPSFKSHITVHSPVSFPRGEGCGREKGRCEGVEGEGKHDNKECQRGRLE